jgi:hypothetical protein
MAETVPAPSAITAAAAIFAKRFMFNLLFAGELGRHGHPPIP